jgi:phage terminase large subunit GpA-like protein
MPLDGVAPEFLANPPALAARVYGRAMRPPPRVDYNDWAARHLVFGPETPFPGRYDPDRFPFFRRILEVCGPEDPATDVTLLKSAQLGGTLIAQIFVAASMDLDPGGVLYAHPTEPNATRWARTKWRPMLRATPRLGEVFETRQSKEGGNSTLYQERRDGRGYLQITGANSAAALSMMTVKRVVKDDLSKWEDNDAGDPESQADSRTKAFDRVGAKRLGIGTGLLTSNCRTTRAFKAGTQEHFHVPCPHCGHFQPLEPENFIACLDPEKPEEACFSCVHCGVLIEQRHRAAIVAKGKWVAHNPAARSLSFYIWAAYAPLESWETLARNYLGSLGDPKSEQVWWNDTAGRAYELPGEAPAWEQLKKRGDGTKEMPGRPRGIVPIGALLLTLTFDCQDEFVDGLLCGWGRNLTRFVVERLRVEGHISEPETRQQLNKLVEHAWPTQAGTRRQADIVGIDANAWTDDVLDWAKRWPKSRVVMTRGVGGDNTPTLAPVRKERRRDGRLVKYQGRFFNVGVNGLKGGLYKFLRVEEPAARGFVDFPAGLEDDYYEQLTAEKRTPRVDRRGFTIYEWIKPRAARNEQLDVMVYGEALAGKLGWRVMTAAHWDALEAEREVAGAHPDSGAVEDAQLGLFMPPPRPAAAPLAAEPTQSAVAPEALPIGREVPVPAVAHRAKWLGGRRPIGWLGR